MDKRYNLKLDLQFRCNNSKMIFDEFDENTSDFFMQITRQGEKIDISNSIPTLLVLKPGGTAVSQILEVKNNIIYGNLENSLKNEVGTYIAKLMLVEGNKKIFISNISYEVTENALLGKIDDDIVEDERYSVLLQLLERLSNIELQEQTRIDNENSRIEAENLREESIEKIKNDIENLITEANKKVNDNLNSNTSKIDNLIIDTKEELNEYKNNKDIAINEDLKEFKENTSKSIENYKTSKDIEIDNILNTYKTNTTNDINSFKNTVNSEINKYKNDKDKAINEYIEAKSLELDNYVEAKNKEIDKYKTSKNNEIDLYISEKNTLIDSKISEVDVVKEQLQNSVNSKLIEVDNAEQIRQQEHEERQQFLNGFEGKLNTVVNDVANIKDDVVSVREANKRQDVFLQGLYNENLDGRVTVKEEGSVISLTNSDDGLVDIVGLEGNTLVNYVQDGVKELTLNGDIDVEGTNVPLTEGVDNGLVDVACEGNTLVNLINTNTPFCAPNNFEVVERSSKKVHLICNIEYTRLNTYQMFRTQQGVIKPNTIYTLGFYKYDNIPISHIALKHNEITWASSIKEIGEGNYVKYVITTNDSVDSNATPQLVLERGKQTLNVDDIIHVDHMVLLEGDYTNKPIPQYFEGMKSVAECEDNKIEILSSNSDNTLSNKKEITLSEPLRALPNGVKDKIVKIGGKWYIERNCGEVVLNGGKNEDWHNNYWLSWSKSPNNYPLVLSNLKGNIDWQGNLCIRFSDFGITDCRKWLEANPITVVYQLKAPTYEELEIEPTLITYNDITHISNNSTIPCNMTVTNTGYNAIIKPSTQYTVAFDTDKSGEVGINLGGSKVTANNNVATVTTPSTLADDTLRLTGKGIKASRVRLLESDKTNWIPSFFEGMQSSFEDKLQDDGTFKMEILSNNKNLLSDNLVASGTDRMETPNPIYFKKGRTYMFAIENYIGDIQIFLLKHRGYPYPSSEYNEGVIQVINYWASPKDKFTFTAKQSGYFYIQTRGDREKIQQNPKAIISEKINATYVPQKSNKIQFSSIEPLRGVGNVKDRFVFKEDGKLMIERNCGEVVLDGNSTENFSYVKDNGGESGIPYFAILKTSVPLKQKPQGGVLSNSFVGISMHSNIENSIRLGNVYSFCIQKSSCANLDEFKQWLKANPVNVVYELAEPTYEEIPHELQKIILEGYENGTLFLDTNIPPTVTASYTANIPVVSKLNKVNETTETNTEDIAITQMAVDFLLMSALGEEMLNFKLRSGYNMASYFASRIIKGALKYEDVINKYPQYKKDINLILVSEGYSDLIIEL